MMRSKVPFLSHSLPFAEHKNGKGKKLIQSAYFYVKIVYLIAFLGGKQKSLILMENTKYVMLVFLAKENIEVK